MTKGKYEKKVDKQIDKLAKKVSGKVTAAAITGQIAALNKIDSNIKKTSGRVPRDIFGNKKFVKLVYYKEDELTTSATADTYGTEVAYRLNSLSNPYVGQQSGDLLPQTFTDMEDIYNHYKVYGAKVTVRFYAPGSNGIQVGVLATNSQDPITLSSQTVKGMGMKKRVWTRYIANTGSQNLTYKAYWSIPKIDGQSKVMFAGDSNQYEGSVTSVAGLGNPAKQVKIHLAASNSVNTTQYKVQYSIRIEYYTLFYDRVTLLNGFST